MTNMPTARTVHSRFTLNVVAYSCMTLPPGSEESAVVANRLTNVEFRPFQPAEHLAASLSVGHLHLISLLPQMEGLIVPSKFYGVLAAGRPTLFVGDTSGELAQIIVAEQVGEVFRPGEGGDLARCIADYADNRHRSEFAGRRARSVFEQKYSRDRALAAWVDMLTKVSTVHGAT